MHWTRWRMINICLQNVCFSFEEIYGTIIMLKFTMFCASNLKCPIIKVSYLLWDSYAHWGGIFYWPPKTLVLNYHYYSILVLRWQNTVSKFHNGIAMSKWHCRDCNNSIHEMRKHHTVKSTAIFDCTLFVSIWQLRWWALRVGGG